MPNYGGLWTLVLAIVVILVILLVLGVLPAHGAELPALVGG